MRYTTRLKHASQVRRWLREGVRPHGSWLWFLRSFERRTLFRYPGEEGVRRWEREWTASQIAHGRFADGRDGLRGAVMASRKRGGVVVGSQISDPARQVVHRDQDNRVIPPEELHLDRRARGGFFSERATAQLTAMKDGCREIIENYRRHLKDQPDLAERNTAAAMWLLLFDQASSINDVKEAMKQLTAIFGHSSQNVNHRHQVLVHQVTDDELDDELALREARILSMTGGSSGESMAGLPGGVVDD